MLDFILGGLGEWLQIKVVNMCQEWIGISTSASDGFWHLPLMVAFVNFIRWVSVGMVAASTVMLLADIIEEAGKDRHIEWSTVIMNFFKGLGFALIAPSAAINMLMISSQLAGALDLSTALIYTNDQMMDMPASLLLIMLIACVVFAFMSLSRFGTMLVQVVSTPLYVSDIVRGETAAMGSWIRQTVAISLTYLIQTILFYLGAYFITMYAQPFLGYACWFALPNVARVLQKFGMSTGVTGVVSSAASVAQAGLQLAARG